MKNVLGLVSRLGLGAVLCLCACGGDDDGNGGGGGCVAALELNCTPAYPPTFEAIYQDILSPTCGSSATGSSCHYGPAQSTAAGQLALSDRKAAYDALLGIGGAEPRVIPGNAACSELVKRLESSDPQYRMPLGTMQLSEARRCAVRQWIANGAPQ